MRILILGGDGYLGWPTAMRFSSRGHDVHVIDNGLRRQAHDEAGTDSLTPIASFEERVQAWKDLTGREIGMTTGDLTEWPVVERLFREFQPEAVVHYGEMPTAPYSMKDRDHAVFTQTNNVVNTLNVIVRDARHHPRRPPREARHHGRVRHPEHRHRRGVHRDPAQRPRGLPALPQAPGLDVPPVEGPRLPQHPLRLPRLGDARDRPEPGRGLRHRDRGDQARRPAGHALRLRRRVRHGVEPLLPAGR